MLQSKCVNVEACDGMLIQLVCMFQFLGDPHLTISHVNYKLDQVNFWRNDLRFYHLRFDEVTLMLGSLSTVHTSVCLTLYFSICIVSVAVSFSDGGGRNYKITEGKNCLWGSSPGNVKSVWSTVLLVEHQRERLDWLITSGFTTEPQKIKKKLIKDVRVVCNCYMEVQTRACIAHFIPFINIDAVGETKVIYQKWWAKEFFLSVKQQWRTSRGSTVGASWRKWLEIWSVQKLTPG